MTTLQECTIAQKVAAVANRFQIKTTGKAPRAVTVVLSEDTLVITMHEALNPAEMLLAQSPKGAILVLEFHQQRFETSSDLLKEEIRRITGRQVREATAIVEPTTGSIVHAFTTGTRVQVFVLNRMELGREEKGFSSEENAHLDGNTETGHTRSNLIKGQGILAMETADVPDQQVQFHGEWQKNF